MLTYYLSLGSNLGSREELLTCAVHQLEQRAGQVTARSDYYYSSAWGFESSHPFCNICVCLHSALQPDDLLLVTQAIERQLGRKHKTQTNQYHEPLHGYSDRLIDIDLLECYDSANRMVVVSSPTLTLPHPWMQQRDFVMIPLAQIKKNEQ